MQIKATLGDYREVRQKETDSPDDFVNPSHLLTLDLLIYILSVTQGDQTSILFERLNFGTFFHSN